jgi:integrase
MGLFKRNRVWWMSFSYQGKQHQESTQTADKKLAEAILGNVRRKIVEGRFFDTLEEKERTFTEMMKRYIKEVSSRKAPGSYVRNQSSLKHLLPYFGEKTLAEVTSKLISAYKVKRREERATSGTINNELGTIRHAFNVAIKEWEWCRDNPMRKVSMEKVNNARVRYLTDEELNKVLQACPYWLKPIVMVARYTGIRRENIVQLQWNQVDLFRKVILLDHTKNGDRLGIPLCERLVELFKAHGKVRHLSGYVFAKPDGSPHKGDAVGHAFLRACCRAGISDFHFHDLRHTFASCLVQRGVDLYRVQRLLGHKTAAMTQRYAHLSPENLREAISVQDLNYDNFMTVAINRQDMSGVSGLKN